jgi:hypothetical protein
LWLAIVGLGLGEGGTAPALMRGLMWTVEQLESGDVNVQSMRDVVRGCLLAIDAFEHTMLFNSILKDTGVIVDNR